MQGGDQGCSSTLLKSLLHVGNIPNDYVAMKSAAFRAHDVGLLSQGTICLQRLAGTMRACLGLLAISLLGLRLTAAQLCPSCPSCPAAPAAQLPSCPSCPAALLPHGAREAECTLGSAVLLRWNGESVSGITWTTLVVWG